MLPTVTWTFDPIFIHLPRQGVAIALGGFAALSFLYGLAKKANDQLLSGLFFAVLAVIVAKFMPADYGIRYYSLLFVAVFLGGHALLKWQITRAHGSAEDANDFIVYGVLGVLVGARLGHVLFYDLDKALNDPAWVLQIWTGGLASHGAVLGLITAMFLFTKRRGIPFLEGSDRFAFSAALGATLVRLGNLLNSEIVGKQTDGTWGFRFPQYHPDAPNPPLRHPSQIYEIVLGLTVLGLLFLIDKKLGKEKRPRGAMISSFFLLYFCGRFVVEFFKEYDGISPDSPLRMGQILSIPGILLGAYGLYWSFKRHLPAQWPHEELVPADGIADEDEEDEDEEDEDESDEDESDEDESDEREEGDEDEGDEGDADEEEEEEEEEEDAKRARKKRSASAKREKPEKAETSDKDDDVDSEFDAEGRLKRARDEDR